MGIIVTIALGALIGWLASILTGRNEEQGWLANIVVGIIGAFIGGLVSSLLMGRDMSALVVDATSLFWAMVGAVVLCVLINLATGRDTKPKF